MEEALRQDKAARGGAAHPVKLEALMGSLERLVVYRQAEPIEDEAKAIVLDVLLRASLRHRSSTRAVPRADCYFAQVVAMYAPRGSDIERRAVTRWKTLLQAARIEGPNKALKVLRAARADYDALTEQSVAMAGNRVPVSLDGLFAEALAEEGGRGGDDVVASGPSDGRGRRVGNAATKVVSMADAM